MRRIKLSLEEQRIHMECIREALRAAHEGPRSLGMWANAQRYIDELFAERTGRPIRVWKPYGLTLRETVERQMRDCEICGRKATPDVVNCIDHDHATGSLRGTLCKACNLALGMAHDNPTRWPVAAEYLARWATVGLRVVNAKAA